MTTLLIFSNGKYVIQLSNIDARKYHLSFIVAMRKYLVETTLGGSICFNSRFQSCKSVMNVKVKKRRPVQIPLEGVGKRGGPTERGRKGGEKGKKEERGGKRRHRGREGGKWEGRGGGGRGWLSTGGLETQDSLQWHTFCWHTFFQLCCISQNFHDTSKFCYQLETKHSKHKPVKRHIVFNPQKPLQNMHGHHMDAINTGNDGAWFLTHFAGHVFWFCWIWQDYTQR